MKIELLDAAEQDLIDGFKFYDRQSKGLSEYFLNTIISYKIQRLMISVLMASYPQNSWSTFCEKIAVAM